MNVLLIKARDKKLSFKSKEKGIHKNKNDVQKNTNDCFLFDRKRIN